MAVGTHSWMSAPTCASNAEFRKWAQGIHDSLVAAGLVQTDDTGQVDLTTMTVPAHNTAAGYEIWRFDDAAQATSPVFVKIEYGMANSSNTQASVWLSIAKGSNGSGALSGGTLFTRVPLNQSQSSSASTSTEYPSYGSGDGSSVNVVLWPAWKGSHSVGGFCIERSRNTDGTPNDEAILVLAMGGNPTDQGMYVVGCDGLFNESQYAHWPYLPVTAPYNVNGINFTTTALFDSASLSKDGVVAPVLPVPCMAPGITPWVSNNVVGVFPGDAGSTSVIQAATINGSTRVYRAFPYSQGLSNGRAPGCLVTSMGGFSPKSNGVVAFPAILWAEE